MANVKRSVITFAADGMNDSAHPAFLQATSCARMTNCQIKGQLPSTRPGIRVIPMGDDGQPFRFGNIQGAMFYNPSLGQSQVSFGRDQDSIVVSAAGRKLHLSFGPSGDVSVSDETGPCIGVHDALIAWLYQAENYAICQDGMSQTWIWDGENPSFGSLGYQNLAPADSQIANQAQQGAYIHGRIVQVVDKKKIVVGDIVHSGTLNNTANILQTTEQIYYATGAFFSPPSALGSVTALAVLPLRDTTHGHADLVVHMDRGIYSLKLDIYPRTSWPSQAISKHLLLGTGAGGQYAVTSVDGDQIFRSKYGVQSIRSAAAQADSIGNPNQTLAEPVSTMLRGDHINLLKFCSMERWATQNRIMFTSGLWIDGNNRGGRGIVSLNMNPAGSLIPEKRSWEGLWTLPPGVSLPIQMISGVFSGVERLFVICTERAKKCFGGYKNSLVEFDPSIQHDILEDGSISRISCQLTTGLFPPENIASPKKFTGGQITFINVSGELDWGVWCRNDTNNNWTPWMSGKFDAGGECDLSGLHGAKRLRIVRNLRDVPAECRDGQFIQCLVRWRGACSLESLELNFEETDASDNLGLDGAKVVQEEPCDYSDYEYSTEETRWEQT